MEMGPLTFEWCQMAVHRATFSAYSEDELTTQAISELHHGFILVVSIQAIEKI